MVHSNSIDAIAMHDMESGRIVRHHHDTDRHHHETDQHHRHPRKKA